MHSGNGTRGRTGWWRLLTLACLVLAALVAAGCSPAPVPLTTPPAAPDQGPRAVPKPTNCTKSLTDGATAQQALNAAAPGQRLCVFGQYVQGASLRLDQSGTPDTPIELVSDGSTLTGIEVEADNVVVEGFNTSGGDGIKARGSNITIRNNDVRGATDDGIRCSPCSGAVIEQNIVKQADGTGILLNGQRGAIRRNDVSGSVLRTATDADGIRFFGTDLRIEDNNVHDISQKGYPPGQEPHTDCFQTFDSDSPTTYGVVLRNNKCVNVDAQCLIASGTERHNAGVPAGEVAIQFLDNYCQSGADQAVYLEGYPNVVVRGNTFSSMYTAAVLAVQGAVDVAVQDNTLVGNFEPYDVDSQSQSGFQESNNQRK